MHAAAVGTAIGGFALWLVDFFGCQALVHGLIVPALGFNPELHAWWHLLTACSLVAAGISLVSVHTRRLESVAS